MSTTKGVLESKIAGFAKLAAFGAEPAARVESWVALDPTACRKWASRRVGDLWQEVALHSDLDPDSCGPCGLDGVPQPLRGTSTGDALTRLLGGALPETRERQLANNFARARRAYLSGELPAFDVHAKNMPVRRDDFEKWSRKVSLPVIGPWRNRCCEVAEMLDYSLLLELPLLRICRETLRHFKRDFEDAAKSGRALNHKVVARWVVDSLGEREPTGMLVASILDPRELDRRAGRPRKLR